MGKVASSLQASKVLEAQSNEALDSSTEWPVKTCTDRVVVAKSNREVSENVAHLCEK